MVSDEPETSMSRDMNQTEGLLRRKRHDLRLGCDVKIIKERWIRKS